jgi:hypothetical protein
VVVRVIGTSYFYADNRVIRVIPGEEQYNMHSFRPTDQTTLGNEKMQLGYKSELRKDW